MLALSLTSPQPPFSLYLASHRITAIVKCREIGWYTSGYPLAVVGEPSWSFKIELDRCGQMGRWGGLQNVSSLVCCAAHLRGGLTPTPGHPLGAISCLLLACMWRGDPWPPSGARGIVPPSDLPSLARLDYQDYPSVGGLWAAQKGTNSTRIHCAVVPPWPSTCIRTHTQTHTHNAHAHAHT